MQRSTVTTLCCVLCAGVAGATAFAPSPPMHPTAGLQRRPPSSCGMLASVRRDCSLGPWDVPRAAVCMRRGRACADACERLSKLPGWYTAGPLQMADSGSSPFDRIAGIFKVCILGFRVWGTLRPPPQPKSRARNNDSPSRRWPRLVLRVSLPRCPGMVSVPLPLFFVHVLKVLFHASIPSWSNDHAGPQRAVSDDKKTGMWWLCIGVRGPRHKNQLSRGPQAATLYWVLRYLKIMHLV